MDASSVPTPPQTNGHARGTKEDIERILLSSEQIAERIRQLADELRPLYAGQDLILVGVLKGALMFMIDLARELRLPLEMDFMAVSSYGNAPQSSGVVRINKDLDTNIEGRNVLLVEDIVDSGHTLRYLLENLRARRPASLRVCALIDKQLAPPRKADVQLDHIGFRIPNVFVVGYGLDYAERYRNLPHVAILKPSAYS